MKLISILLEQVVVVVVVLSVISVEICDLNRPLGVCWGNQVQRHTSEITKRETPRGDTYIKGGRYFAQSAFYK